MKASGLILCALVLMIGTGCSSSRGPDEGISPPPDFTIVDLRNTSTAKQTSFSVYVVLPSHYSEKEIRSIVPTITKTMREPESEITMFFYGPHSNPRGAYDIAQVVWTGRKIEKLDYRQPLPRQDNQRIP